MSFHVLLEQNVPYSVIIRERRFYCRKPETDILSM